MMNQSLAISGIRRPAVSTLGFIPIPPEISGAGGITSQGKWDRVTSLISQGINAWGRNPTSQVYSGVNVVPSSPRRDASDTPIYSQTPYAALPAGSPGSLGQTAGSGIDGVIDFIGSNPMLIVLVLGGAYLLFRDPPRRR